jgi:hypothetical protein
MMTGTLSSKNCVIRQMSVRMRSAAFVFPPSFRRLPEIPKDHPESIFFRPRPAEVKRQPGRRPRDIGGLMDSAPSSIILAPEGI